MREVCLTEGCGSPAMARGRGRKLLGIYGMGGLCDIHTMRTGVLMEAADRHLAKPAAYEPAEPYREWVSSLIASGTVTYRGLTLTDLQYKTMGTLLDLHPTTLSRLVNGRTTQVRTKLHQVVLPFMVLCSTAPAWPVAVGQRVTEPDQLRYVPPGTAVVDQYGRVWQYRDGSWAPAHTVGTAPRTAAGDPLQFYLPARIIYVPPALQNNTTP